MDKFSNLIMDECPPDLQSPEETPRAQSRGVAMSFGFKKRPNTAPVVGNSNAARRLANSDIIDKNGNDESEPLTANAVPSGRTTPRLVPPRKEASATRVSRFGFRQPNAHRLNKVADLNTNKPARIECGNNNNNNNNNKEPQKPSLDANKNNKNAQPAAQISRYTLQATNLPKPEMPLLEPKTAKTLANNNKKISSAKLSPADEGSSRDGSNAEDSGVESHSSRESSALKDITILDSSPNWRRNRPKPRNFSAVVTGNTFDLTDLDEGTETGVQLPQLPSAFTPPATGIVRERAMQYQRQIDNKTRLRKISLTSSEGCSDYGEEEKTYRDKFRTEKSYTPKTFLKSRAQELKDDSSPLSSDDPDWLVSGGEALADTFSCSFSSSDESKSRETSRITPHLIVKNPASTLHNMMTASLKNSIALEQDEVKSVLLTIEDPKFAAVAAASKGANLLEDEPSPVESLICSYSENEEFLKNAAKKHSSSSNSKDINEKTPSTPGTPTNASNSLSLSDGKDYFDDEIADQPGLIFDEPPNACNSDAASTKQHSEATSTLVESTPKPRRRTMSSENSPLPLRNKKFMRSRTGSVDTLSPCESIASDDLMLDFDLSQGSGLDDIDRIERIKYIKLDEDSDERKSDHGRDWQMVLSNGFDKGSPVLFSRPSRLLRSRTGTPNSVPDSPRSLDSRTNARTRSSTTHSPLRLPRGSSSIGYDSDDSLRFDRASHSAMVQDVMSMKTMLLKLKRVLHEQADEDYLMRSETHNPFDKQNNGLFNGLSSEAEASVDPDDNSRIELADLRRQVIFLQGQLEDREHTVQLLHEQIAKVINESNSAPASTVSNMGTSNAATQTERLRPISAGPSLLHSSSTEGSAGSLVSATDSARKRSDKSSAMKTATNKLWRTPGEPPLPSCISNNNVNNNINGLCTSVSIPKRSTSKTRAPPHHHDLS